MIKRFLTITVLSLCLILFVFYSIKLLEFIGYKCPLRVVFNFYCAGCGSTRMMREIFNFNFYQAFRFNPLMFILFVLLCIYCLYGIVVFIKKNKVVTLRIKYIYVFIAILTVYMVLRNIPLFDFLKPTLVG